MATSITMHQRGSTSTSQLHQPPSAPTNDGTAIGPPSLKSLDHADRQRKLQDESDEEDDTVRPEAPSVTLPKGLHWLHFVPIQVVLSPFGMAGLASCWLLASKTLALDTMRTVADVFAWWTLLHACFFLVLYIGKAALTPGEVRREWSDHNSFNYFCGVPLSIFILGGMVQILWSDATWVSRTLWLIGVVGDIVFNINAIRRWLGGTGDADATRDADEEAQRAHETVLQAQEKQSFNRRGPSGAALPATSLTMAHRLALFSPFFLTSPSTGFYAALLGTTMWSTSSFTFEFLWLPWSLGAFMFLIFFILLTTRLVLVGMVSSVARPTMMLPLANLAMATVSYIALSEEVTPTNTTGSGTTAYDNFARVMFFVTCVYACAITLMLHRLFVKGFSSQWFSTTFPLSAFASLLMMHQKYQATRVNLVFAMIALGLATVWNVGVLLLAYVALLTGSMCVPNPKPAPILLPGVKNALVNIVAGTIWLLCAIGLIAALLETVLTTI